MLGDESMSHPYQNAGDNIELEEDFSDYDEVEPTIDATDEQVAGLDERFYTKGMRGPRDVVLSGPVMGGWGPGRYFRSKRTAYRYLVMKYGHENVRFLRGSTRGRWSYLIRNLKGRNNVAKEAQQ